MEFRLCSRPHYIIVVFLGLLALEAITMVSGFDYGDALDKTLLFFEAQRAGKLPYENRVKWRKDSAMRDGYAQGVSILT